MSGPALLERPETQPTLKPSTDSTDSDHCNKCPDIVPNFVLRYRVHFLRKPAQPRGTPYSGVATGESLEDAFLNYTQSIVGIVSRSKGKKYEFLPEDFNITNVTIGFDIEQITKSKREEFVQKHYFEYHDNRATAPILDDKPD